MTTQLNKLDFSQQNIYVGLDVHKKQWKATIMSEHMTHKTFSMDPDPEKLHQYLEKNFPGGNYFTAYEAGFSGFWAHKKMEALGIKSIVVNAADVPTTHKDQERKNDKRDSRKIAKSLRNEELKGIYVPSDTTLQNRALIRSRTAMVNDIKRCKNRIKAHLNLFGISMPEAFINPGSHWSKRFIEWLKKVEMSEESGKAVLMDHISVLTYLNSLLLQKTRQIRALAKSEFYKENVILLISIPGIGLLTAMLILTEIENIDRFRNNDAICDFIGIVPSMHSSGEKDIKGRITKRGHDSLRTAIIESAWTAARHDPALHLSYIKYMQRMPENKAIVRVAKKLVCRISYVLKNKKPYVCSVVK